MDAAQETGASKLPEEFLRQQTSRDVANMGERVNSVERAVSHVESRLEQMSRDTTNQIRSVSDSLMNVSKDLSAQIQAIAVTSAAASTTNWGNVATIAGVLLAFGGTVIAPIVYDLHNLSEATDKIATTTVERFAQVPEKFVAKDEYKEEKKELTGAINDLKVKDRDFIDQRQFDEFKNHVDERNKTAVETQRINDDKLNSKIDMVDGRVNVVDSNQVKRPEIVSAGLATADHIDNINKALGERIDTLSIRMNTLQTQINTLISEIASVRFQPQLPKGQQQQ